MCRGIAQILLNLDTRNLPQAEEWIKKAIVADNQNGTIGNLGRDYAFYSELLKKRGDKSKAREKLNKAIDILTECGADGWVEKYEKELAELS